LVSVLGHGILKTMNTNTKKRVFTPHFKFKVVREAITSDDMTGTARRYGVNHTLLAKWKRQVDENGHVVFETSPDKKRRELEKKVVQLEQMIGKREVELNLIKNFSDFYESRSMT
jgi:transposase